MNPRSQLDLALIEDNFNAHADLLQNVDLARTRQYPSAVSTIPLTLIEYASILKRWEAVRYIAQYEKAHRFKFSDCNCALTEAVDKNQLETARVLLKANYSKANMHGYDGSLMHLAVKNNNPEMIKLLLSYNFKADSKNSHTETPLELAVIIGAWECAECLIPHDKSLNWSEIFLAAIKAKQFNSVGLLLQYGPASLLYDSTQFGEGGCLHIVIRAIFEESQTEEMAQHIQHMGVALLRLLLAYRHHYPSFLCLEKKNQAGQTPIELAYDLGLLDCVTMIAQTIDPKDRRQSFYGFDLVLLKADAAKQFDIVHVLARAGNPAGYTETLMAAVEDNRCLSADALLKAKVVPAVYELPPELKGDTVGHVAVRRNNSRMLALLMMNGVNLEKPNGSSLTLRKLADQLEEQKGSGECFRYVMQNAWEMNTVNKDVFFELVRATSKGKTNGFARCGSHVLDKIFSFWDGRRGISFAEGQKFFKNVNREQELKKAREPVVDFLAAYDRQFFHSSESKIFTDKLRWILQSSHHTSEDFNKEIGQQVRNFRTAQAGKNVNTMSLLALYGLLNLAAGTAPQVTMHLTKN